MKLSKYKLLKKYIKLEMGQFFQVDNHNYPLTDRLTKYIIRNFAESSGFKQYLRNHYLTQIKQSIIKMIRDFKLKRSIKKFIKG